MKHIKKKFLFEKKLTAEELSALKDKTLNIDRDLDLKKIKSGKDDLPILITENDYMIQGFFYSANGNHYIIPEPDQVLIYFHSAQSNFRLINEKKKELLKNLLPNSPINEDFTKQIFNFFGLTSGYIIFLFSSIEAFLNQLIPDEYIYKYTHTKKTELYNKEQIQKYLQFDDKLKKIVPEITGKNFMDTFPLKAVHISNLKQLRDELIHPKHNSGINKYDYLSKRALNFKYEETIGAVRDLLNFYKADYVVECGCGAD